MPLKYDTLQDAVALAEFAHRNQRDKAGFPYVEHPKRVLSMVQSMGAPPYVQIAAILHDVIEDTPFTGPMLLALGIPGASLGLIHLVSRNWGPELDYYGRIRLSPGALMIKKADIQDNTSEWRLSYLPEETQARMRSKYAEARRLLGIS